MVKKVNFLVASITLIVLLLVVAGTLSSISPPDTQRPEPFNAELEVRLAADAGINALQNELSSCTSTREASMWLAANAGSKPVLSDLEFGHARVDVFLSDVDGAGEQYTARSVAILYQARVERNYQITFRLRSAFVPGSLTPEPWTR